jgi:hypothetical protein
MYYYPNNGTNAAGGLAISNFFSARLQAFLYPLLVFLGQLLDRRLVSTFAGYEPVSFVCVNNQAHSGSASI